MLGSCTWSFNICTSAALKGPVRDLSSSAKMLFPLYILFMSTRMKIVMGLLAAGQHPPSFHTMGGQFRWSKLQHYQNIDERKHILLQTFGQRAKMGNWHCSPPRIGHNPRAQSAQRMAGSRGVSVCMGLQSTSASLNPLLCYVSQELRPLQ